MARTIDGPLSADDLTWMRARYPESYVDRMVDLYGLQDGAGEASEEDESGAQTGEGAGDGTDGPDDADGSGDGNDEDLIGDAPAFDVLGSTEQEVRTWAETASDADKASALSTEQARSDREPRKGVVSILS